MSSYFENVVITIWLTGSDEDRDMELTADFAFVEPTERWDAPAGSVVNMVWVSSLKALVEYSRATVGIA